MIKFKVERNHQECYYQLKTRKIIFRDAENVLQFNVIRGISTNARKNSFHVVTVMSYIITLMFNVTRLFVLTAESLVTTSSNVKNCLAHTNTTLNPSRKLKNLRMYLMEFHQDHRKQRKRSPLYSDIFTNLSKIQPIKQIVNSRR